LFDYQKVIFPDDLPLNKIALVSISFKRVSDWNGKEPIIDLDRIKNAISITHSIGKPFRFWATPDTEVAWKALYDLGVDFINTDMVNELASYRRSTNGLHAQDQAAMSFNIRYDNSDDGENRWGLRKEGIVDLVRQYSPDFLGIQEGLHHQVAYLDTVLTAYGFAGVGRDDGKTKGEYSAIFYHRKQVQLLLTQTYWLSETPDKVSVGWDASMERIVTYGKFKNLMTNEILHVFNCHFDHKGEQSRLNAAKLITELLDEKGIENEKLIVMGDLNCLSEDPPVLVLKQHLDDSYSDPDVLIYGPEGTWNGFNNQLSIERRIDFILTKNLRVSQYMHLDERRDDNLFLSDHLPVLVRYGKAR
ncbi:MAG: endonuclease/exonuclease/phosphatase family protein, partial [Bacteroidota bacterium]